MKTIQSIGLSAEDVMAAREARVDWDLVEVEPLGDMVVFTEHAPNEMTGGGLYIPEEAQRPTHQIVVAVGPKVTDLKPGDCCAISKAAFLDPACIFIRNPETSKLPPLFAIKREKVGCKFKFSEPPRVKEVS